MTVAAILLLSVCSAATTAKLATSRRFLRRQGMNEEERAFNLKAFHGLGKRKPNYFAEKDLVRAMDEREFRGELFAKWFEQKFNAGTIRKKKTRYRLSRLPRFEKLLLIYINKYEPWASRQATAIAPVRKT
ncbi:hypothetical protein L916_03332 [Phytophthora nicotianae]|uniref:RxLR effector protein n=1 Tax=Phytophthora nicotianae TaxID=4792 RepID=W2JKF6_PHYNI|nr:hypothetical protein L916_03332 [Phytophthora nicotianae]